MGDDLLGTAEMHPDVMESAIKALPTHPTYTIIRYWNLDYSPLEAQIKSFLALKDASVTLDETLPESGRDTNYAEIKNPTNGLVVNLYRAHTELIQKRGVQLRSEENPNAPIHAELETAVWDYNHHRAWYLFQPESKIFVPQNPDLVKMGYPAEVGFDQAPPWFLDSLQRGDNPDRVNAELWLKNIPSPSKVSITPMGVLVKYDKNEPSYLLGLQEALKGTNRLRVELYR